MDWYWLPVALVVGVGIGLGGWVLRDWMQNRPAPVAPEPRHSLKGEPPQVIVRAPMVNGVTLKHWLINEHPTYSDVWFRVVKDFYETAAANPNIARYFGETIERGHFERLQKHFLTDKGLTDKGLTDRMVESMRERHARLLIRPEDFDATVQILVQTLRTYRVRYSTIEELVPMITILRKEMVK